MKSIHALEKFLEKLTNNTYTSRRSALAALRPLNMSNADDAKCRASIDQHFAPKPETSKLEEPTGNPTVAIRTTFDHLKAAQESAIVALRIACDGDDPTHPYTDADLRDLVTLTMQHDVLTAFTGLFTLHGVRISPSILDIDELARHPRFFHYVNAIFNAHEGNIGTAKTLLLRLPVELERRHSDPEQVAGFEKLVTTLGTRIDLSKLGPLIVEFASLQFVLDWLRERELPDGVHQFTHRVCGMYLNEDTDAAALMTIVQKLHPELRVVEEIVRVLLSQRQLGDALGVIKFVPDSYKPRLRRLLQPVVMQYGDPIALLAFGMVFHALMGQDERDAIRTLVKERLTVNVDQRINDMLNLLEPRDFFESIPSSLDSAGAAALREEMLGDLGQPSRRVASERDVGGVAVDIHDILEKLRRGPLA